MQVFFLVASILAYLVAPFIYVATIRYPALYKFVSFTIRVVLLWTVFFHIIPECWAMAGTHKSVVLYTFLLGFILFSFVEYLLHRKGHQEIYLWGNILLLMGIIIHSLMDGIALIDLNNLPHEELEMHDLHHHETHPKLGVNSTYMGFAIVIHRLPFALLEWELLRLFLSPQRAYGIILILSLSTLVGYFFPRSALVQLEFSLVYIQSFIAGALLHVALEPVFHFSFKNLKNLRNTKVESNSKK